MYLQDISFNFIVTVFREYIIGNFQSAYHTSLEN